MSDDKLDEYEAQIHEIIVMIQRDYEKQVAPYLKKLCEIQSLRTPKPILVRAELAAVLDCTKEKP